MCMTSVMCGLDASKFCKQEIGEKRYFDNYNGSNRSYTQIHKVSIPRDILDEAKEYSIHSQKITYRGPFGGFFGRDISIDYTFRPVDVSDGFKYYSLSDIHMAGEASAKAADYMKDKELLAEGTFENVYHKFYK